MLPIFTVAKKEIMDNIRNKWILVITFIFALLTLVVSYFTSQGQGWQDLEITIFGMTSLVQYIVPIIGLMLGYAAIVREVESGSMSSFLAHPVERWEVVVGKFLGLGFVLSFSILVGFGIAGIIIGLNVSNVDYLGYLIFIVSSVLLGLVYLSLSMLFSTIFKSRSTSMGIAIFTWFFFAMIWGIIMTGLIFALEGDFMNTGIIPDWYYGLSMINPISSYGLVVSINVVPTGQIMGSMEGLPGFVNNAVLTTILIVWIILPLFLSVWFFDKKDI